MALSDFWTFSWFWKKLYDLRQVYDIWDLLQFSFIAFGAATASLLQSGYFPLQ